MKQQTLAGAAQLNGVGLHSGATVQMKLRPAPPDHGIAFRRTDLDGAPQVPARVERVTEVRRGTVLEVDGVRVRTVEHLLSAVSALGIDNLVVELDGEEPPAVDGSAEPFTALMLEVGIEEQDADAVVWACETPFVLEEGEARYAVVPDERLVLSASIEFDHPLIQRQHASLIVEPGSFREQIGASRTFGFLEDADSLRRMGLAHGADPSNTVVLTADGLYEGVELRYEDEFIRHKILDMVGDLALTGRRIQAQIVAERPGHRGNIALARAIVERASTRMRPAA